MKPEPTNRIRILSRLIRFSQKACPFSHVRNARSTDTVPELQPPCTTIWPKPSILTGPACRGTSGMVYEVPVQRGARWGMGTRVWVVEYGVWGVRVVVPGMGCGTGTGTGSVPAMALYRQWPGPVTAMAWPSTGIGLARYRHWPCPVQALAMPVQAMARPLAWPYWPVPRGGLDGLGLAVEAGYGPGLAKLF